MHRPHGFTLMDLMIAMATMAILVSLGIPGYLDFSRNQRLAAAASELAIELAFARQSAAFDHRPVTVCPSLDQAMCAAGNPWAAGRLIFIDGNLNREREPDETILRVGSGWDWAQVSSGARERFRFMPDGNAVGTNGSIRLCDERGATAGRRLVVSMTGRVRLEGPGIDHC